MAVGKKAIFFSIVSIILVAGLIYFYMTSNRPSQLDQAKVIEIRIMAINSFISDIEHDITRGLYISSVRSFVGLAEYITENGTFLKQFNSSFSEIMINGTINNRSINITTDANLGTWMNKIIDIGRKLDIEVKFVDAVVKATHEDPWKVTVSFSSLLNLTDMKGLASWQRSLNLSTVVNIIDFEDPFYTVTSSGKMTNKIVMSNITDFVSGTNAANLILHANNSWYIASTRAPTFLQRFTGNTSSSPYGIESIVNIDKLKTAVAEIYKAGASSVDYMYFGNISSTNCQVNETKFDLDWLNLDSDHLATYEAHCAS